jgi:hypothetical protein
MINALSARLSGGAQTRPPTSPEVPVPVTGDCRLGAALVLISLPAIVIAQEIDSVGLGLSGGAVASAGFVLIYRSGCMGHDQVLPT